ncbi:matrilin-4 [Sinocyclocheilus rhinocerous]|uniref:matrilin-4 n=1 Tax=Sinocyclocheilus rhinocerous TaxID=307959 RepID=UPI0007B8331B|nr:PREDICTED: matrilin-4-like [Sinocyclocheilus rhinocerous]
MTRALVYVGVLIALIAATEARPKSAEPKCKSGPVDLVFIIDGSRSVRAHEFETMRKFMIDIIHELNIGLEATRVGVVQYSSQVQNVFSLKAFSKPAQMVKAINEIIPLAQGTMTGLAIRYAMNVAFSAEEGARPNVPHVAVIVTDGRPQDRVAEVAAAARESGLEIYAIGVARADMTSLRAMASPPFEDHVFLVESFDLIHQFGLQFQDKLCGMDLCLESDHGCEHICESSPGSYHCLCLPGYTLNEDGKTCTPIDLCAEGKHDCDQICIASPGSFTCDCNTGYMLNDDKRTCTMIDYCSFGNDSCEHQCVSVLNGFNCRCNEGYSLNDDLKTCTMIDYCSFGNDSCEHECVSVLQSFYCRCHEGYTLNEDETTCTMIDYCSFGNDSCEHECVSVLNGFNCRCNDGYSLNADMKTCTMIDYCSFGNDSCEHQCVSVLKGFHCVCNDGYTLNDDKKTCTMIDYCSFGNDSCEHECVSVLKGFHCLCNDGYTLNDDKKTCTMIDYCSFGNDSCEHQCESILKGFHCICNDGYSLNDDMKTCTMIDYCSFGNDSCEHECVSVLNGFNCRCNEGYSLNDDLKTCTMIDYCSFGNDSCEHECVSVLKGFHCRCKDGYTLSDDEKTCTMIDYCSFGNHSCDHHCVSVLNGFYCRCNVGYTLQEDGKTCQSDNLCNTVEHGCEYQCVSTPGSYHCICPEGHVLQDDGKSCGTCRSSNIDLVLLIDGSKSVRPQNFELVKQFVNQVVDQLDVSPKGTRVGLVQYSSRVRTEFPLSMYQTKEEIKKAVMNVEYMEKGTMTGLALKHMVENSFSEADGARPAEKNIPRVGLVFTDGRSQDDIQEWAKKAKDAGITMYAVGVGKAVEDELREIASEPMRKHFFYTADFTAISQIAENLKLNVCAAESQGEIEVKDPCACESLVEFQQVTMSTLDQLNQKLSAMTKRLEVLESQLLTRK